MSETICDPRRSRKWQGKAKFLPKLARTSCSGIWYRTPPPPQKWKVGQILALLTTTEHPPPPNWNLGRSWQFEFWLLQNIPPQLKFRQILALWILTTTEHPHPPTPPPKLKFRQILTFWVQLEYVETNCCIPQGYHLVQTCKQLGYNSFQTTVLFLFYIPLVILICHETRHS